MTTIIHLSDLHIGTEDVHRLPILIEQVNLLNPDVVVISGDFTQRAKQREFKMAKDIIDRLTCGHVLCVPGNHDIPLYRIIERLLFPYQKYKKYIASNFNPTYCNNGVAIIGLNSTTPYTIQDGIVSSAELKIMREFFDKQNQAIKNRIVIMHHNMIRPECHKVIYNLESVIQALYESRVNFVLSGHLHDACIEKIEREYIDYPLYAITAGTALSSRLRSQPNSFNWMTIEGDHFEVKVYVWKGDRYSPVEIACFM